MSVAAAVIEEISLLVEADPGLVVLTADGHGAAALGDHARTRVILTPAGVRGALAAGLCGTGRPVVSLWGAGEAVPAVLGDRHLMVVVDADSATALWARGAPVVSPCWAPDVGRQVRTALVVGEPVVLHAPEQALPSVTAPLPGLEGGQLRWLRPATGSGAVLASGLPTADALAAATALAVDGLDLGVVEVPWQAGARGRSPGQASSSVLLLDRDEAAALAAGRLAPDEVAGRTVPTGPVADLAAALRATLGT